MSGIKIEFKILTDNDAFVERPEYEIQDIVDTAVGVLSYKNDSFIDLYDSNGNKVGYASTEIYNDKEK